MLLMKLWPCAKLSRFWLAAMFLTSLIAVVVPAYAGPYADSSHGNTASGVDRSTVDPLYGKYATGNCAHCHEQHASLEGSEPNPAGGSASPYLGFALEQALCLSCHDGSPASTDIAAQFAKINAHPELATTDGIHRADEDNASDFDFDTTQRHAECTDCHNPHVANAIVAPGYDATSAAKGPIIGATGVDPNNGSAGIVTSYTFVTITDSFEQYKVCFKCHSTWSNGTGTVDKTAQQFNVNNDSYHYVEGDKPYTRKIASSATFNKTANGIYAMMPRYAGANDATLLTAKMLCSDCHGPSDATVGPEGVHGSDYANILKVPSGSNYNQWGNLIYQDSRSRIWCFNCHAESFSGTGFANGTQNLHTSKHNSCDQCGCQYCHLPNPHGPDGVGSENQRKHLLRADVFYETVDELLNYGQKAGHDTYHGPGCT